jgi:nucleoside-diphosphate-sugar epimerase
VTESRVLITGATGFVGSHVVERFANTGLLQRVLVRPTSDTRQLRDVGADLVVGSLNDEPSLRAAVQGVDIVVHLAAATHARGETEYRRVNDQGTRNLIRAALGADPRPRRFVYLSSLAAAGPSMDGRPVAPDSAPRPLTAYGRSKLAGEVACRENRGIEFAVLRAAAVYGPRDSEMLRFFKLASLGWMPLPAGPRRRIQLIHVSDLADAIARAALEPAVDGLFHIAEPRAWDWTEAAGFIADAVGRKARIVPVPVFAMRAAALAAEAVHRLAGRSSMFNRDKVTEIAAPAWICETDRAENAFGFHAAISLPDGLRQTADWYRQHGWL